jgi:glyoxylase-like metal-dependent hydrolase (beta-lactamase superfamily II)
MTVAGDGTVLVTGVKQRDAWLSKTLPPVELVRPGLWSVPVPIPDSPLRYTLCYFFADDAGVVVVDPGWDTDAGRDALSAGLAAAGARLGDVTGVVVTHIHPDHHGLSGWLRDTSDAWIAMHPAERDTLPGRIWNTAATAPSDRDWLRTQGVPDDETTAMIISPDQIGPLLAMAEPDRLLHDGDRLPIPGRDVLAVWTPGHTPGHLCLHDADAGVLLTGDHLLPRISPNIGVHHGQDNEPLADYLQSLERVTAYADSEALPAHEYRFRHLDARARSLVDHHRQRCEEIIKTLERLGEATAWQVAAELTWSRGWTALPGMMRRMALAETIAHLQHLLAGGDLAHDGGRPELWRHPRAD